MLVLASPAAARLAPCAPRRAGGLGGVPAAAAVPRGRRTATTTAALPGGLGPGGLFGRVMIPNPSSGGGGGTVPALLAMHPRWGLRESSPAEVDTHGRHAAPGDGLPHARRRVAVVDVAKGHRLLEALQQALYSQGAQGCQVRRETQAKYALACDGVSACLNESHKDVVIDVQLPANGAPVAAFSAADKRLRAIEETVHRTLHHD